MTILADVADQLKAARRAAGVSQTERGTPARSRTCSLSNALQTTHEAVRPTTSLGKSSIRTGRHIIKGSDDRTPYLGFNEFYSLKVLKRLHVVAGHVCPQWSIRHGPSRRPPSGGPSYWPDRGRQRSADGRSSQKYVSY